MQENERGDFRDRDVWVAKRDEENVQGVRGVRGTVRYLVADVDGGRDAVLLERNASENARGRGVEERTSEGDIVTLEFNEL
mgnify:FL=1